MDFDNSEPTCLRLALKTATLCIALFASQTVFAAVVPPAPPAKATLAWTASPSPGVSSYNIYIGTAVRNYAYSINAGYTTSCIITNLTRGVTYYFAATALSQDGIESDYSEEVVFTAPITVQPKISLGLSGGGMTVSAADSSAGYVYNVLATEDMNSWSSIATVTANSNGQVQYTDPNSSQFKRRFYRLQQISP